MHVQLRAFASIFACPSAILLFLNFPGAFYRNNKTRNCTVFLIWGVAASVIAFTDIDNSMTAYFIGIFATWFSLRAFLLITIHAPHQQYCRIRLHKTTLNAMQQVTIRENTPAVWERFPSSVSWARLAWTVDLLANFRGIGWHFLPCSYDVHCETCAKAVEAMVFLPGNFSTLSLELFKFLARFILALTWINVFQIWLPSQSDSITLKVDSDYHKDIIPFQLWSRLLYVTMSLAASFAVVDLT
jgi:hypothetical protein